MRRHIIDIAYKVYPIEPYKQYLGDGDFIEYDYNEKERVIFIKYTLLISKSVKLILLIDFIIYLIWKIYT